MLREEIEEYITNNYITQPEYLWVKYPSFAIYRHRDNKKWFVLTGTVPKRVLGIGDDEPIDIINVKAEPLMVDEMQKHDGFLKGYHMNKKYWMTILLDGTVPFDEICEFIDISFNNTK